MGRTYFVSGIDTGVGKTIATGMMARSLMAHGVKVTTVKLVQTGCHGFSEDLEMHRKLMGIPATSEDLQGLTFPQTFDFPASPHFAAEREGRAVDVERISDCVKKVSAEYDVTLVEGAGGLAVPLTHDLLTIDYARSQGWPAILVCSGKLGSLNHAILSIEALAARGIPLAGIVYNHCAEADPEIDQDTPRMIREYLDKSRMDAPLIRLGFVNPDEPEATDLPDFTPFFR